MKIVGGILIAFGLVDMIGSFTGLDVWSEWIGVNLPDVIWSWSAYIEIVLGYFLIKLDSADESADDLADESGDE